MVEVGRLFVRQAPRLQSEQLIGRRGRIVCGEIELEASCEKNVTDIDEESSNEYMLVFASILDSEATLLGHLT